MPTILAGWKTYLTALLLALVAAARYLGWMSPEAATTLETLLLGGGLAFLRNAQAKTEDKIDAASPAAAQLPK